MRWPRCKQHNSRAAHRYLIAGSIRSSPISHTNMSIPFRLHRSELCTCAYILPTYRNIYAHNLRTRYSHVDRKGLVYVCMSHQKLGSLTFECIVTHLCTLSASSTKPTNNPTHEFHSTSRPCTGCQHVCVCACLHVQRAPLAYILTHMMVLCAQARVTVRADRLFMSLVSNVVAIGSVAQSVLSPYLPVSVLDILPFRLGAPRSQLCRDMCVHQRSDQHICS